MDTTSQSRTLAPSTPITSSVDGRPARAGRRRSILGTLARAALLLGLLGLTSWQATRSPALVQARDGEESGNYVLAVQRSLEHLERRPWSREASLIAARSLSRLDFAERAEPYYQRVRSLPLEDRHYRAYGLVRANLRERAINAYEDILARHPADVTALQMISGVMMTQSSWDDVRAMAERLIALPDEPVTLHAPVMIGGHWTLETAEERSAPVIGWTFDGIVNHNLKESEAAVSAFETVLELDPDLTSMALPRSLFWSHLAEDLLREARPDDALRYLSRALEDGTDPELLDQMGRAHLQKSNLDEAEQCWRSAIGWAPDHFGSLLNLGKLDLQRGRPDEAIRSLRLALQVRPESYEVHYSLGLAYRRIDREDLAHRHQEKAEQIRTGASSQPGDS